MYILKNIIMKKKIYFLISFCLIIISSGFSFAQLSSLKQLKKDTQSLNQKEGSTKSTDPWTINQIITADELSKELSSSKNNKPVVLHVGFDFLYNQEHIPGAKYIGPASRENGIQSLKNEVKNLKKDQSIIIYCGCCPWGHCPNIRPAFKTLKELGFNNVKVLYLPDSFAKDWKGKGYAIEGQVQGTKSNK